MSFAALGSAQRRADDAEHDRNHGDVLAPSHLLVQHALPEEQQHEQTRRQRWLHHHQRGEQQRHHLQRPTENRHARAEQPARTHDQIARKPQAQVHLVGSTLGVHRLQRHP
jgi:hypothetical protein